MYIPSSSLLCFERDLNKFQKKARKIKYVDVCVACRGIEKWLAVLVRHHTRGFREEAGSELLTCNGKKHPGI